MGTVQFSRLGGTYSVSGRSLRSLRLGRPRCIYGGGSSSYTAGGLLGWVYLNGPESRLVRLGYTRVELIVAILEATTHGVIFRIVFVTPIAQTTEFLYCFRSEPCSQVASTTS